MGILLLEIPLHTCALDPEFGGVSNNWLASSVTVPGREDEGFCYAAVLVTKGSRDRLLLARDLHDLLLLLLHAEAWQLDGLW